MQVFGGGHEPKVYTPPKITSGVWDKPISVDGKKHDIKMAWDDIEIAKAQSRVFENADPFKLKNSVYTFVVLRDGTTSFGNPVDETELGTRHAHLAHGRPVVASGELAKSNSGLRLNFISGTYMVPMLLDGQLDPHKLREAIVTWFDQVLRAKYHPPASFKVNFKVTKPDTAKDNWGNDKIFETEKAPDEHRLPPPTMCDLKEKLHACDAKFGFHKRNEAFCKEITAASCGGVKGAGKGSASAKAARPKKGGH